MTYFNYRETKYSFQTVWYRSAYSYCCCECGFQHEFVDYITKFGSINEDIYEKILLCVLAGNCPHVYNVPPEYIHEASVYAVHIAAVAGNYRALEMSLKPSNDLIGALFRLNAYQLILMKNPAFASKLHSETGLRLKGLQFVEAKKLKYVNSETIRIGIEEKSAIDYIKKGSISIAELENDIDFSKDAFISTLKIAFKCDLGELQDILTTRWHKLGAGIENTLEECCILAIIYDKPEILHFLLHRASQQRRMHHITDTGRTLCYMCDTLRRWHCKQVLLIKQNFLSGGTYQKLDALNNDNTDLVKSLVNTLFTYDMREEIMMVLRKIPDVSSILNHTEGHRGSILHNYNCKSLNLDLHLLSVASKIDYSSPKVRNPSLLKQILDLHVDINHTDRIGMTPLVHLLHLKRLWYNNLFRDAEELYVFENPDLDMHKTVLLYALRLDKTLYQMDTSEVPVAFRERRTYIMDGRKHGLQGHVNSDFALNFMVPFFIECGFALMNDFHEEYEKEKDSLNPEEQVYIQQCLQTPRSLLLLSRCSLRRHFNGRRIHRFVEMVNIPKTVRDLILLKPLLKCVPRHLLH